MEALVDSFGRVTDYLRLSVTDRCNLRCRYCMPAEGLPWVPREQVLNFEEIVRFVRIAITLGVTRVRITGGEPLLRRDLPAFVEELASLAGIEDLSLTTNGILLSEQAHALYRAGLRQDQHQSGFNEARGFCADRAPQSARSCHGQNRRGGQRPGFARLN